MIERKELRKGRKRKPHPREQMKSQMSQDADLGVLRIQVGNEEEARPAIKVLKERRKRLKDQRREIQDQINLTSEAIDEVERKFPTGEDA
jgi:hypothetical protein